MLVIAPEKRITVAEALEHPYFAEFHDPEDEPVADPLHAYDFDFELYDLGTEALLDLLYDEVMLYHDENALDRYIEDRMTYPEGRTGARFGLQPTGNAIKQYAQGDSGESEWKQVNRTAAAASNV